jgi:hypothetical protein
VDHIKVSSAHSNNAANLVYHSNFYVHNKYHSYLKTTFNKLIAKTDNFNSVLAKQRYLQDSNSSIHPLTKVRVFLIHSTILESKITSLFSRKYHKSQIILAITSSHTRKRLSISTDTFRKIRNIYSLMLVLNIV